ncbi:hypothetical protein SCP_0412210 [Sparassis crispa]|uniref:Uncharacterized protein n=1 Tax=Sparassis crispa TaxID=139825 RepID=A0A401GL13_9APHY|nr:hypothetical protein SCP_0412210 [Sparassis crispa]GBE82834.1 hypothetical protein SCP_0412210 [Sparassis crispa]
MPPCRGACTPTAPVMQDTDDVPATSPAPGARDHDSAAPTRASTVPQCSCTTAPAAAAAQDANDAHATSPARGVQARDSPTPTRLAVRATDRPTAQVVPSAPTHHGCTTEPAVATVQDADVATDTPLAPRMHHAGADARARPASLTHHTVLTASGAHTQDNALTTLPTPRARQASATTRERTTSPTHPITTLPMHHAASPVRGARVHDNTIPVRPEAHHAVPAVNHPMVPMDPSAPLVHPPSPPTTHPASDVHDGPPPPSCTIKQPTSTAPADHDAAPRHRTQDTPEAAAPVYDGAQLLPHPPLSTLSTPLLSVPPLQTRGPNPRLCHINWRWQWARPQDPCLPNHCMRSPQTPPVIVYGTVT